MAEGSRLFCSKPFRWFEVSRGQSEGEVYVCCPAWLSTPIGNLLHQSVAEVWNGEMAQELRRSILDGSFKYCDGGRCPFLQRVDGPVQYVEDVTDPEMRAVIDGNLTELPFGPRDINCSYDRSCNLSCPSCRTELIMETDAADRILGIQRKINDQALKDARLLYITGSGDPFGSPYFRKWLQTMRRADMPRLEVIHLHSNGLLWSPRMWATIPEEIRALVTEADISIDAASAATYAENRRGGEFERLVRNLDFIGTLRADGPLRWFGINMTVQANNYAEMRDFVALGRRVGADSIAFHQIVNWGTFSDEDFVSRAIHRPDHPRHQDFLAVLADPLFDQPGVFVSNLTALRAGARAKAA